MKNFNLPTTIMATYKIITPMFIGDADKKASWISPISFKGVLRFWWRALAWGRIRSKHSSDKNASKELHTKESELFGDTENGRGRIAIKIVQLESKFAKTITDFPSSKQNDNSAYLAYGLMKDNKNPHREAIIEGGEFRVTLILDKKLEASDKKLLENTLEIIGLSGGLGSRSRRANGCIQLTQLNNQDYIINDYQDYQQKVQNILQQFNNTPLAPYSSFSQKTQYAVSQKLLKDARIAHSTFGGVYKNFRGQPSTLRGEVKTVFGLPLAKVDDKARRASPLFFHIIEFANQHYGYSVLYLPTSIFHTDKRNNDNADWQLAERFVKYIGDN